MLDLITWKLVLDQVLARNYKLYLKLILKIHVKHILSHIKELHLIY